MFFSAICPQTSHSSLRLASSEVSGRLSGLTDSATQLGLFWDSSVSQSRLRWLCKRTQGHSFNPLTCCGTYVNPFYTSFYQPSLECVDEELLVTSQCGQRY